MHIPDGFLDPKLCLVTGAVSASAVGGALRRVRPESEPELAPRMGVLAAYVFAAQMVNFPVAAGTSGHLLGALLAAVLLGPNAAAIVMAAVFVIQAFFFLDGGHTALGANILNMGLAGTYGGYAVYRTLAGSAPGRTRCLRAAAAAAWCSVMLGAALTAAELALSGRVPARVVFPPMLGVHALIGVGEAAITAGALALLWRVRPDLLTGRDGPATGLARWGWAAAAGLAMTALLAPLASGAPDGLERVAGVLGFESSARPPLVGGPFPDYELPGVRQAPWAPTVVSVLGAGLMLAALGLLPWLRPRARGLAGQPLLARLDARVKLGCALALVLAGVLVVPGPRLAGLLLFAALWVAAARVPARWLLGRAALLLPFVGLGALSLLHGEDASRLGPSFLRAGVSFLATGAFLAGTPAPEVLAALTAFRAPRSLAQTLAFALRYLRAITEDAGQMLQARAARSCGAGTLALRAGTAGGIVGSLFVRSFERAERVSLAMAARGYSAVSTHPEARALAKTDVAFMAGFGLFLAGVILWPGPR